MRASPIRSRGLISTTNRLPALSKARSQGSPNSDAKMPCFASQVSLKISPPLASLPETNRFCAEALEQIKRTAPKHAILLNNCPALPQPDLNLVSLSLVFIVVPLLWFLLVNFAFTEVMRKTEREVTRKIVDGCKYL